MGSIYIYIARRIILASIPQIVLASIISLTNTLQPLLAKLSAWLLNNKRGL